MDTTTLDWSNPNKVISLVYKNYYKLLITVSLRITNNLHDSENIVQEVLVRFWKTAPHTVEYDKLSAYLCKATINQSITFQRQKKAVKRINVVCDTENIDVPIEKDDFDEEVIKNLYNAINMLPAHNKNIMNLFTIESSPNLISELTGFHVSNVKAVKHRAIGQLRKIMTKKF